MCGRHSGERAWWLVVAFVVGPGIGCGAGTPAAANGSCGAFVMPNTASAGLPHSASYTANGDGTVTDNVTGFLWEGTLDPGQYTRPDAAAYCAGKGGLWRLPSKLELISLVDLDFAPSPSMQPPAIDPAYFPDTPPDFFWSSTLYADETLGEPFAWYVFFQTGFVNYMPTSGMARVRCVSAQSTCVANRYQFQDEGLVYDRATTLTWQRSAEGGRVSWEEAKSYCAARGPGWRLPSLTEMHTTIDNTKLDPAQDAAIFPVPDQTSKFPFVIPTMFFWTSSAYAGVAGYAWSAEMQFGSSTCADASGSYEWVRCIR